MLPFGASSETKATTYCSNRLPASEALLGEPLEYGRNARARKGEGFASCELIGFLAVCKNLLKCKFSRERRTFIGASLARSLTCC